MDGWDSRPGKGNRQSDNQWCKDCRSISRVPFILWRYHLMPRLGLNAALALVPSVRHAAKRAIMAQRLASWRVHSDIETLALVRLSGHKWLKRRASACGCLKHIT